MRIAIDTTPLTTGHAGRGVGIYTKYLIDSLKQYETKHSYTLFTRGQKVPENVDLVHYPYFDPFFLTLPLLKQKPTIVTVHDLIPLVFPDKFPSGVRGQLKWQVQKISLLGAKRIITDSHNSKKDIINTLGYSSDSIDVVHLAPSTLFQKTINIQDFPEIQKQYKFSKRYIVYVGDVNWNKNIEGLLVSFSKIIHERSSSDIQLVCIGKAFTNNSLIETQQIKNIVYSLKLEKSIVFPGFVPDADLAGIYAHALCYIQPSYYEGFGFPVLEAMVSGCPVVCSNVSSLSEIMGPSIPVQPDTIESIVTGIKKCIGFSEKERSSIIQKGKVWANTFSWKTVARQTVLSYEKACI
jgi:glycosyltransferase involved in cell wall biosynthesis